MSLAPGRLSCSKLGPGRLLAQPARIFVPGPRLWPSIAPSWTRAAGGSGPEGKLEARLFQVGEGEEASMKTGAAHAYGLAALRKPRSAYEQGGKTKMTQEERKMR